MTDGLQPEYVDAPTCRVCGVALADHPKVSELCRTVFTLAAKVQRIVAYETCTGEIECTCWGCLMDRSKWQKGEIERLKQAVSKLISKSHQNAGNIQNPFAWVDQRDWEEFVRKVDGEH